MLQVQLSYCHSASQSIQEPRRISLPGSKYIANRLVIIAALSQQASVLHNVPLNNDINTAIVGLRELGVSIRIQGNSLYFDSGIRLSGTEQANVYTSASGTFSRFITAVAALVDYPVTVTADAKMSTRPMADLFQALEQLGVSIQSEHQKLPCVVSGAVTVNQVKVAGNISSQYISALMMIGPVLANGLTIKLSGDLVSEPYIQLTQQLMQNAGVSVEWSGNLIKIAGDQCYQLAEYTIAPDPVSASYFMAFAQLSQQPCLIEHFDSQCVQGETKFYQVLQKLGMKFSNKAEGLLVTPSQSKLTGGHFDMGAMPDVVQTLAVLATQAGEPIVMENIAHLAFKESNRIEDTATELRKLGVSVETSKDSLKVFPCLDISGVEQVIETHDDHRMAMSMALLTLVTGQLTINHAQVVAKSFPDYWEYLQQLGVTVKSNQVEHTEH